MSLPAEVQAKLDMTRPYTERVASLVKDKILGFCEKNGYAFAGRLKDGQSIYEKIESGRYRKWSDLDDSYGCTVVIPTLLHEPGVLRALREMFVTLEERQRGSTQKSPEAFRFDATRYIGRLPDTLTSEGPLSNIKFEIQIRTAFEHAWSVTTHSSAYKGDRIDWRRLRLAAQLKASVEQLDMLVVGFDQSSSLINHQIWPEIEVKQRVEEVIRSGLQSGKIPSEVAPLSWMRLCDNVFGLVKGITGTGRFGDTAKRVIDAIETELSELPHGGYPRSLSIMQFVLGAVVKGNLVSSGLGKYTPLVTDALRSLYPDVSSLKNPFNLELNSGG